MQHQTEPGNLLQIFKSFVSENKLLVSGYALIFLAYPLEEVVFPEYYGRIIETLTKSNTKTFWNKIKGYFILLIILIIVMQTMFIALDNLDSYVLPKLLSHYRETLVKDVMHAFEEEYHELEIGEIISKIIKLPNTIQDLYHQFRNYILPGILVSIIAVLYFTYVNYKLGIVTIIILAIFYIVIISLAKVCTRYSKKRDKKHNALHEEIDDSLNNLLSVYSSNNVNNEINRIKKYQEDHDKEYTTSTKCSVYFKIIFSIMYVLIFIIINGFPIYLAYNREIQLGRLISIIFINTYLIVNIQDFAGEIRNLMFNLGILSESQSFLNNLFKMSKNSIKYKKQNQINIDKGDILISNLYFRYPEKKEYLFSNFNLHIPSNEKIIVMGEIGSGKSTLIKLLLKLFNYNKGSILIDGFEINKYSAKIIRNYVGYVSQNTKLFNRTIYENIIYGSNNKLTKNELNQFINHIGINKLFKNLPHGINTLVGKNGEKISGGQRQAVMLLRMIISDKKILLLDEPTSALDEDNKEYVFKVLKEATKNKTSIIISHDKEILKIGTRFVYFEKGQITKDKKLITKR